MPRPDDGIGYDDRPRRRGRGRWQCPFCDSDDVPRTKQRVSTTGWIVFCLTLLMCGPFCLLALFIRESYRTCADCGTEVG